MLLDGSGRRMREMKGRSIRVIDTGLRGAAENIAWDRALMTLREQDKIADTIRFLRFTPSAIVGYHQRVADEIRVDYCRASGIEINRRVTGGGAIYFDEGQLGWELIFKKSSFGEGRSMEGVSADICESAASALRKLGVNACFRPRNDLEVEGRKISGTGGAFEKNVILFQGTLLLDFDMEQLLKALRIPVEKLTGKEIMSARERVASVNEILGRPLPVEKVKEAMSESFSRLFGRSLSVEPPSRQETQLAAEYLKVTRSSEWIDPGAGRDRSSVDTLHVFHKSKGGILRVSGRFDREKRRLKQVFITGDVFVSPRRTLYDIEAVLKETRVDHVVSTLERFFGSYRFEGVVVTPTDFIRAVSRLIDKFHDMKLAMSAQQLNAVETLNGGLQDICKSAGVLLVPYCAKPLDCEWRNKDHCSQCGKCTVGEAYKMAEEAGMRTISIHNYENLIDVLENERKKGAKAFVGACCSAFFVKRHKAFADSGMSCAIVDINDTTCYELNEEDLAYKGKFEKQTNLKLDVLQKVLSLKKVAPGLSTKKTP